MRRYLSLLGSRPFATLWGGATVSAFGDSMTWVALVWLAFERGGPGSVSALVVAATAPVIVGGLALGVVLDRFDRRAVLICVNATLACAVGLVPLWAHLAGPPPTWLLLSVAALYGFLKIANWAGVPAMIPALVPAEALNTANAMESMSFGVADVAGPAVAGALIAGVGAETVLAFDTLTYLVFLVCLVGLRGRIPQEHVGPDAHGDAGLRPALRFLWRTPPILATTLMFMAFNVGEGMLLVLLPSYTSSVLEGDAATYGLLLSAFSVGALTGSLVVGAIDWRPSLGRSIAVAQTLAGATFLVLALEVGLPGTVAVLLAAGLLISPLTIWAQTIRMRLVPEGMRGRVFGVLRTFMQATPPLGGAAAGILLGGPGVAATVVAMTAIMAVPGVVGLVTPALAESRLRPSVPAPAQPR